MSDFIKNFADWFRLKPELDTRKVRPQFNERDIWWCHIGSNVGFEIDGKNDKYTHPVLILKKISKETALVLPLTTKLKSGSWYIPIVASEKDGQVILSQAKTIDSKRLKVKIERLAEKEFYYIKEKFIEFLLAKN